MMNKEKITRRLHNLESTIKNRQPGVTWIPYYKYFDKVKQYVKLYKQQSNISINSNIQTMTDLSLKSMCIDKVIDEYLKSKLFHFQNIGVIPRPFKYAPKTAVLLLYSKEVVSVAYEVLDKKTDKPTHTGISQCKQYHRISVTNLDNGKNRIRLLLLDKNGTYLCERMIFIWFRKATLLTNPILQTENYRESAYSNILITGGAQRPFVFHSDGSLMHYLDINTSSYGILPLTKDRFLWPVANVSTPTYANPHSCLLYEMDYMGRIHRTFRIPNGIHHFACLLPNNHIVSISNSNEEHTEDILVEIDRLTGQIVRTVYAKELFGTHLMNQTDWAHPNSIEYNENDDSMLVCYRNIHTIANFNWCTLEINWILSPPDLWKGTPLENKVLQPTGSFHYSFQAHAAQELKEFGAKNKNYRFYLVFDNHRLNRRPLSGYTEDGYSYINIYGVNESTLEVKQFKHLRIDLSLIRSNALYCNDKNRIFNMSGCMAKDKGFNHRGKIEEYDYDTHRLINRWLIRKDFFSAYPFEWDSNDYCTPIGDPTTHQYDCGKADSLVPFINDLPKQTTEPLNEAWYSNPYIEEHYLHFYTTDHSIDALVLEGTTHIYHRDYTDTVQTYDVHRDRKYYCVVSLKDLPADSYKVKVIRNGLLYETDNHIKINRI